MNKPWPQCEKHGVDLWETGPPDPYLLDGTPSLECPICNRDYEIERLMNLLLEGKSLMEETDAEIKRLRDLIYSLDPTVCPDCGSTGCWEGCSKWGLNE